MEHYVLITETTGDLGLAYAKRFAGKGCNLIMAGRRREVTGRRAQETKDKYMYKIIVILVDLASEGGVRKLLASLEGREVHVLMNNASFGFRTPFSNTDVGELECLIYLQITAVTGITHHALKEMKEQNKGIIINISSDRAFAVMLDNVTYAVSKRSIATLTKGFHIELMSTEIRAQAVCPGFVDTDFHESSGIHAGKTRRGMFGFRQPEDVVDEAMKEFEKGKITCIPGRAEKLVKAMTEYMPKRIYYRFANDFVNRNIKEN